MSFIFLSHAAAYFSIVAGLCFLSVGIILREWFVKGGFLRKKYYGDYGLAIYMMICLFFIIGGCAALIAK
jgi:hypothetical protein